jgi:hypothetical protein
MQYWQGYFAFASAIVQRRALPFSSSFPPVSGSSPLVELKVYGKNLKIDYQAD